ncbi:MAG TPA: ROK family protein [Candidatus Gastranaerophilales bacterium]|nr:ROK family protein [Candidatus Gastranaerophilales bacterium]
MEKIIGIDIGGTKINFACVQRENIISEVISCKTPDTAEEILNSLCRGIFDLIEKYDAKGIGIATAGTVDLENSKVTGSTGNLPKGYEKLELKKVFTENFKLPVLIENDANAAAFAEFKAGNAKGHLNTLTVTLGTGIGGGIIVDGKLLKGKTGAAAEVGHIPMTYEKLRKCSCGSWDCWEAYASGTGYAINAKEIAQKIPPEKRQGILKNKVISELTTYDVIEGLKNNDFFSIKVHDVWEEYLSMGFASLINIFEPESIVLSGGMAKAVNYEALNSKIKERIVIAETKLIPAQFENNAGIIGAALLLLEKL